MGNRVHNIVAAVVLMFVPSVYFYGVFSWKSAEFASNPTVVAQGQHIYFVCFSSALYGAASVAFMLAKPWWLKLIASSVSSVCAVILYEEVRYGNNQWTEWSYWLIVLASLNYFVYYCLIDRYKKKIKYE